MEGWGARVPHTTTINTICMWAAVLPRFTRITITAVEVWGLGLGVARVGLEGLGAAGVVVSAAKRSARWSWR